MATALAVLVATSGCFLWKDKTPAQNPPSAFTVKQPGSNTNLVITPSSPVGRIASVNKQANIVIVSFAIGQLPANNTRLAVFHAGMKTGEVNITGPAVESLIAGDIIAGAAQEGDEVRAE